jgi:hypothetical protein
VLPVGFEKFHRRGFLNYQFNRAHGLGWADGHELRDAAARTRSTGECVAVFEDLSAQAAADGRLRHAVGYLRLAEFFTPPRSAAKVERYRRFRALFDAAFTGGSLIRHAIPYAGASLPAYWLPAAGERLSGGAVLIHGGFDSLIEEFYPIWQRIAMAGFDVVAFGGPCQGWCPCPERPHVRPRLGNGRLVLFWTNSDFRLSGWSGSPWADTGQCALRDGNRASIASPRGHPFSLALPVTGGHARPGPHDATAQTADALERANPCTPDTDSAADRGPHPAPG